MTLTIIALAALSGWIYLALLRGGFWRASERLADAPDPETWPEIVAVIPARDEAEFIGEVVAAHMKAGYPGAFSIVLVDDHSSDGTADIARKSAEGGARNLMVIPADELPVGWTGKLWAIHQGLQKAQATAPNAKYILLTDADIVLAPDTLSRLVAKAENKGLALASLMARLDTNGYWGGLLIPAFVYFFQKLYPFAQANDPTENVAAAAGGCMLVRADALQAVGGVEPFRDDLIDDCALARRIKDLTPATKIWIGLADEDEALSRRNTHKLAAVWDTVARTAYAQLRYSPALLALAVAGMMLLYLAPPLIAFAFAWHGQVFALLCALAAWGLMAYTYWPTLKLYGQEPWQSTLLPIAAVFYTAMTVSSALRHWQGRGGGWKGRHYETGKTS